MIVESTWTYRVVRQIHPEGDSYTIREIYTDTEIANGKPVRTITAFSAEPEYPMGETPQELMENLEQMMEAQIYFWPVLIMHFFAHTAARFNQFRRNASINSPRLQRFFNEGA